MASQKAIVDALREIWLFQSCPKREVAHIAKAGVISEIPAGFDLVKRGERGRRFFTLLAGRAVVERPGFEPKRIGPGTAIGEIALLDGGAHSATVRTISDCTVFAVSHDEFDRILNQVPPVAAKIAEALAMRLRTAEREVERLRLASQAH
jgi:trk system potassium uptake protein TrkA